MYTRSTRDGKGKIRTVLREEFKKLKFRKTNEDEIFWCGVKIAEDSQSGPIYCGEVAEYIALTESIAACSCKKHPPKINL